MGLGAQVKHLLKRGVGRVRRGLWLLPGRRDAHWWGAYRQFAAAAREGDYRAAYQLVGRLHALSPAPKELERTYARWVLLRALKLAVLLERPIDEVVRWGERLVVAQAAGRGPRESTLALCCVACNWLALCGRDDRNAPLARALIEGGARSREKTYFLWGCEYLLDGAWHVGRQEQVQAVKAKLVRAASELSLEDGDRAWFDELMERDRRGSERPFRSQVKALVAGHPPSSLL